MGEELEIIRTVFGTRRDLVDLFADPARARELFASICHPDIEFEFVGSEGDAMGVTGARHGLDAMLAAWGDWLEPYSAYTVEARGHVPIERGVLSFIHTFTRTRTADVELEQDQAAVWRFRDGKVSHWEAWLYAEDARAEFGV